MNTNAAICSKEKTGPRHMRKKQTICGRFIPNRRASNGRNPTPTSNTTPSLSHPSIAFTLKHIKDHGPNAAFDGEDERSPPIVADGFFTRGGGSTEIPRASSPSGTSSSSSTTSSADSIDSDLLSAGMSAFARMEAQMRAKKKSSEAMSKHTTDDARSQTSTDASAYNSATASPSASSSSLVWKMKFPLQKPIEPTVGMCCGRDCPNCVWIQYSQQLAEYEEEQAALGINAAEAIAPMRARNADESSGIVTANSSDSSSSSQESSTSTPLGLPFISSPGRTLSKFERAMEKEREMMAKIIPQGKGQKRALGAVLLPKQKSEEKKE